MKGFVWPEAPVIIFHISAFRCFTPHLSVRDKTFICDEHYVEVSWTKGLFRWFSLSFKKILAFKLGIFVYCCFNKSLPMLQIYKKKKKKDLICIALKSTSTCSTTCTSALIIDYQHKWESNVDRV